MREGGVKYVHIVILLNDFRSSVTTTVVPIRQQRTVIVVSRVLENSLWLYYNRVGGGRVRGPN